MPIARSYFVIKKFCPNTFDSFTIYKKWSRDPTLYNISITPTLSTSEYTREGAICVSFNMPHEIQIQDVKSYLKHGTLFIEGKTITRTKVNNYFHYLTAIRLPKSFLRNPSMIKTEIQEGIYKATLSLH